jgi:transcriptional regulator
MKKLEITYQTIAQLLNTTEGNIRIKEHRGDFNIDNLESVISYLAANILLNKIKSFPEVF